MSWYLKFSYEGSAQDMQPDGKEKVLKFINETEFLTIGTVDEETGTRLSVLSKLKGDSLEELYFTTALDSHKIKNLQKNPACELMFYMDKFSEEKAGQVNFSGEVEILTSLSIKKEMWEDMMKMYFPDGPEDENMCILKFTTKNIRAMLL